MAKPFTQNYSWSGSNPPPSTGSVTVTANADQWGRAHLPQRQFHPKGLDREATAFS